MGLQVTTPLWGAGPLRPVTASQLPGIRFGRKKEPTLRERGRLASLETFKKLNMVEPFLDALSDQSSQVRLAAFDALRERLPLTYNRADEKRLKQAQKLAKEALLKYGNGLHIKAAIQDLQKEGYRIVFGNEELPYRVLTEPFLEGMNWDEERIEDLKEDKMPIKARELFSPNAKDAAVFKQKKPRKAGYFIFSDPQSKVKPETFWHEYFHYLQAKTGLADWGDMSPMSYFKRELEANQFVLENRDRLGVTSRQVMRELKLWKHNLQQMLQAKLGSKKFKLGAYGVTS